MPAQSLIAVTVRRQQAWWHRRVTRGIEERPVAALDLNGQIMVPHQRGVEALAEVVAGNRRRRVRERVADQLELALQQHQIHLDEVALDEDADQQAKQPPSKRWRTAASAGWSGICWQAGSCRRLQNVARATRRADQLRLETIINLHPQTANRHLDDVAVEVHVANLRGDQ